MKFEKTNKQKETCIPKTTEVSMHQTALRPPHLSITSSAGENLPSNKHVMQVIPSFYDVDFLSE